MIPQDLLADIDALVGQQNRNDFLIGSVAKRSQTPSASPTPK